MNRYVALLSALLCISCGGGSKESSSQKQSRPDKSEATASSRIELAEDAIQRAVLNNDTVTLRRVIFENPDFNLNRPMDSGDTLLTYAIKMKFNLVRNVLLEKGANPDIVSQNSDYSGQTPLMIAASIGETGSIMALLDAGAAINNQDWLGDTALLKSIKSGTDESARALIYAGADLKIKNDEQESALDLAERFARKDIADYLRGLADLDLGAPTTPLFRKILTDADIVNYRKLIALHPDVPRVLESINPLLITIESTNENNAFEIAVSLLALDVSPNGPIVATTTPLNRAVALKKRNFTELLIRNNADVNLTDNDERPALYYAIQNNDERMVDLLINSGAKDKIGSFKGCKVADAVKKRLTTELERDDNQRIQSRLGCFWTR